jgi:L-Ala-D/L-Glu epimerase
LSESGLLKLRAEIERWPLVAPFRIAGHVWKELDVLVVTIERDGLTGRGEAAGVYYKSDTPAAMLGHIEALRPAIEAGVSRSALRELLPPGGARNALDCALWDLEAKWSGSAAWKIAGMERPRALLTTFTCGADEPEQMAAAARGYVHAKALKIKLMGDSLDAKRLKAVRDARPDVWLGVDGNQGFNRDSLERLVPTLVETDIKLVEQPFPIGRDDWLDELHLPIPLAADESVQNLSDIDRLVGRYTVVNVKLDKCGGLTEGIEMVQAARRLGLDAMVGNMLGTSLAMAPAFLLGQLCQIVDLDGPIFLKTDRAMGVLYSNGLISCPEELWGGSC